jgi:hypothetical protein
VKRLLLPVVAAALLAGGVPAAAQVLVSRSGPPRTPFAPVRAPAAELAVTGGVRWTWARAAAVWDGAVLLPADVDLEDSGFRGVELDLPLRAGTWLALLHERQDTDLVLRAAGPGWPPAPAVVQRRPVTLASYHLGVVQALRTGPLAPFTLLTVGVTSLRDDTAGTSDHRFGMIAGVGAKLYAGRHLGLRAQLRLPLFQTGGDLGFASTGFLQTDLSAGAFARF